MQEIVASVLVLKDTAGHLLHEPWAEQTRRLLRESGLDLRPLADLIPVPSWYIPDFLTPPPTTPAPDFQSQLAALRATPPAQVRADLEHLVDVESPWISELHDDPTDGLDRLAYLIERYWNLAIAPHWPRLRALQQGDVLYRGRRLADGGATTGSTSRTPATPAPTRSTGRDCCWCHRCSCGPASFPARSSRGNRR